MHHLPLVVHFENFSLILCLNTLILLAHFNAPLTLLCFHIKTEQNLSVLASLHSHCSTVKTELFQNANENAWIWNGAFSKRSIFRYIGTLSLLSLLTWSFEHRKTQLCGVGKTFKEFIGITERSVRHIMFINLWKRASNIRLRHMF